MAYSSVRYSLTSGNMGTNSFSYSAFRTLGAGADPENTQFDVYWNDTALVLNTDYTVNTTNNTITMLTPVTGDWVEGDVIAIKRDTKKDARYVDWTNNAGIDEADLDLDGDQLLFIAQEAWDESQNALRKNASHTKWYGEGLESYDCAPATVGSGWVTLDQVNNLINGGDTATLGDVNDWCFTGDGVTTDFVMNGASANTTEENLFVAVNGVTLCPCDPVRINSDVAAAKLDGTIEQIGITVLNTRSVHLTEFVSNVTDLAEAALAATDYYVQLEYTATVTNTSIAVPTNGTVVVGTKAEILAWIATWTDNVGNVQVVYDARVVGYPLGYTWDQATRTLSFTDAPLDGADICVRQITGTVAVDLADVSLDGSEIQDDAITIDHLDFASGTSYRVLKIDAAGDPSVGTITSAYVSDFAAAVNSLQWRAMTAPTASVNVNSQLITNVQAGSSAGDAVNFGQLTTTNTRVTTIETKITGGSSGDSSDTGSAVTPGIHPDLWYNNAENSRGALVSGSGATACAAEVTAGDSNLLMSGFVPRWLKIFISGDIRKDTAPATGVFSNWVDDVSIEFEFLNWDVENGYTGVVSTEDSGNRKVYNLNVPRNHNASTKGDFDWPSPLAYGDVQLVVETISPYRVWLRLRDASDSSRVGKITKYNDVNLPGSLQVVAIKGL